MSQQPFFYGGQAVIEGVMIRGRRHYSLAVRRIDGQIHTLAEPLSQIYTGKLRQVPLIRGILVLIETLSLGIKALNKSALIAVEDQTDGQEEVSKWTMAIVIAFSLALGIGIFFLTPLFATRPLEDVFSSDPLVNLIEGVIRLILLVGYIGLIGLMPDIRRVFAYHGAEHMAVHTHEAGLPLDVEHVRRFPHRPSQVRYSVPSHRCCGGYCGVRLPRQGASLVVDCVAGAVHPHNRRPEL